MAVHVLGLADLRHLRNCMGADWHADWCRRANLRLNIFFVNTIFINPHFIESNFHAEELGENITVHNPANEER